MATVTGGGATNVLNVGSNDANGIATTLAAQLSTSLQNGSLVREPPGQNPSVGGGLTAILTAGTYQVAPADSAIVVGDHAGLDRRQFGGVQHQRRQRRAGVG